MKSQRKTKSRRYKPRMLNLPNRRDSKWREKAPRLTEDQKVLLARIVGEVHDRHKCEITRQNFPEVHERMEEEIFDRVLKEMNMWSALEWRGVFSKRNYEAFKEIKPGAEPYLDQILPVEGFLRSETFALIEQFQPRVVLLTFSDYTKHIDSAEQAVRQAEQRRYEGNAYFTPRDQAVHYAPRMPNERDESPEEEE